MLEFNESVYKEKSSEFIAQVNNVGTFEQADEILEKVIKKNFNATHYCYVLKFISGEVKSSDNGEPKSTA